MSVLIKGIHKPNEENCTECPCFDGETAECKITKKSCQLYFVSETHEKQKALEDCPLVEVPTPHGRLIEEPKALSYSGLAYISRYDSAEIAEYFSKQIKNQPTVIEAENEDE